jgi:hypothetical protein
MVATRSRQKRVTLSNRLIVTCNAQQRFFNDHSGLLLHLFQFLSIRDIMRMRLVDQRWLTATLQPYTFHWSTIKLRYNFYIPTPRKQYWQSRYQPKHPKRIIRELTKLEQRMKLYKPKRWLLKSYELQFQQLQFQHGNDLRVTSYYSDFIPIHKTVIDESYIRNLPYNPFCWY